MDRCSTEGSALSIDLINAGRRLLANEIRRTPIELSQPLSTLLGVPVYMKLEFLQVTGSFKVRGAMLKLSSLTDAEKSAGVVTCSSGNSGLALAWAAGRQKIKTTVFVPRMADASKLESIRSFGGQITQSELGSCDDVEIEAQAFAKAHACTYISAFDDPWVMAGNGGTLAAECHEDLPEIRHAILPVSGGGLAGGFAYYMGETCPDVRVIGAQHEKAPSLAQSLAKGSALTRVDEVETIAGGIIGGVGLHTFEAMQGRIQDVALVSESEIGAALRWMLKTHKYLIEPTAAVPLAALLNGKLGPLQGPIVLVLSGRNVAYETLQMLLTDSVG